MSRFYENGSFLQCRRGGLTILSTIESWRSQVQGSPRRRFKQPANQHLGCRQENSSGI